MKWYYVILILFIAFIIFAIIHKIGKNKRPVKRAFLSFLSGIGALLAVDISSIFTGVYLPISLLSILISVIGGIPGVTSMLCLNLFF